MFKELKLSSNSVNIKSYFLNLSYRIYLLINFMFVFDFNLHLDLLFLIDSLLDLFLFLKLFFLIYTIYLEKLNSNPFFISSSNFLFCSSNSCIKIFCKSLIGSWVVYVYLNHWKFQKYN